MLGFCEGGRRDPSAMTHIDPVVDQPPRMLSVAELAERLGVHRNTIHREVRRGRLQSVKVGKLRRFRPQDVETYLSGSRLADLSPGREVGDP